MVDRNRKRGTALNMRVVCIKCGYQDEPSEMRPVNRRTLFGDLVDDSKWLCSDCDGDIETEREREVQR